VPKTSQHSADTKKHFDGETALATVAWTVMVVASRRHTSRSSIIERRRVLRVGRAARRGDGAWSRGRLAMDVFSSSGMPCDVV
jgi:hypothetical protein